jgi:outer membrane lipoprotein SlyB
LARRSSMAKGIVRPRSAYNVVAIYEEMKPAREAVPHLERAGIEAGDISVVADEAEEQEDTSIRDARVVGNVGKRVVRVGTLAAVVGGLLGWLLGLWLLSGAGVWLAVAAGAIAGSLFGGFLGGMAGLSMSDDWELTFESRGKGGVAIAIGSDDREEIEKAAQILTESGALRVERFDSSGRRLAE